MGRALTEVETAGACFTCRRVVRQRDSVFFGPGALMKCAKCGAWNEAEWGAGNAEFRRRVEFSAQFVPPAAMRTPEQQLATADPFNPATKKRSYYKPTGRPVGRPPKKKKRTTQAGMVRFWITTDPTADVA